MTDAAEQARQDALAISNALVVLGDRIAGNAFHREMQQEARDALDRLLQREQELQQARSDAEHLLEVRTQQRDRYLTALSGAEQQVQELQRERSIATDWAAELAAEKHERQDRSRDGMVTVYDDQNRYVGCMGVETWRACLRTGAVRR